MIFGCLFLKGIRTLKIRKIKKWHSKVWQTNKSKAKNTFFKGKPPYDSLLVIVLFAGFSLIRLKISVMSSIKIVQPCNLYNKYH